MDEMFEVMRTVIQEQPVQDAEFPSLVKESFNKLSRFAAKGGEYQVNLIIHEPFHNWFKDFLFKNNFIGCNGTRRLTWISGLKLLVNIIVQNECAQNHGFSRFSSYIVNHIDSTPLDVHTGMYLAFLYNVRIMQTKRNHEVRKLTAQCAARVWKTINDTTYAETFDYLHFIFELIIVKDPFDSICGLSSYFTEKEKLAFLDYVNQYLLNECPNGEIHGELLKYISESYKKTADRFTQYANDLLAMTESDAAKLYTMLRILGTVTSKSPIFQEDHSLFINTAAMLTIVSKLGKESNNIFTPLTKLEEVAPNSIQSKGFENENSYELKTQLMRIIANLLHDNPKNKQYAYDMNLMPVIMECTNIDARNPMLREYSILAIREACENCPIIQEIIAKTAYQGPAQNDLLAELNINMGTLRIQSKDNVETMETDRQQ